MYRVKNYMLWKRITLMWLLSHSLLFNTYKKHATRVACQNHRELDDSMENKPTPK